ncbi:MAG: hypothetical protein HY903_09140 [Deltaproteobacteria bacterium]|nr:hypothetical protein [Deltaproteobacteria bacterium]
MNKHVNAFAGRLSLRPPQRRSLEVLDRIAEIVPPQKQHDLAAVLAASGRRMTADSSGTVFCLLPRGRGRSNEER